MRSLLLVFLAFRSQGMRAALPALDLSELDFLMNRSELGLASPANKYVLEDPCIGFLESYHGDEWIGPI